MKHLCCILLLLCDQAAAVSIGSRSTRGGTRVPKNSQSCRSRHETDCGEDTYFDQLILLVIEVSETLVALSETWLRSKVTDGTVSEGAIS